MITYIGIALFGLIFFVLTANQKGAIGDKMSATMQWIQAWAPYSYILLLVLLLAPLVSIQIVRCWPEHKEPEDPMRRYRTGEDVVED